MRIAGQRPGVLELLKHLVDGTELPQREIWETFAQPRNYLIDPVALSQRYGNPASQRVVANTADWEAGRGEQMVDVGAAFLDLYLRDLGAALDARIDPVLARLGITHQSDLASKANLSGLRKIPTAYYPISDDIHYKRQYKPAGMGANQGERGTVVEFINLPNTPMMDWDTPGPYHADRNATVRHLGDVEELIENYTANNPDSHIQLYQTPGGFRAWDVGQRMNVSDFKPHFEELKVDPDYALISQTGLGRTVNGVDIDPPGFRSRISHKPARTDWVAQPIATFGARTPDPTSYRLVQELHDEPIRRAYLTQSGVSPAAIAALKEHLPTASQSLQQQLISRFAL